MISLHLGFDFFLWELEMTSLEEKLHLISATWIADQLQWLSAFFIGIQKS